MNTYGLNNEQLDAIWSPSPLYLHASAGSGKTRCLTEKIHYLLDSGVPPESIVALTFTNKAAKEMKDRLEKYADVKRRASKLYEKKCRRKTTRRRSRSSSEETEK